MTSPQNYCLKYTEKFCEINKIIELEIEEQFKENIRKY